MKQNSTSQTVVQHMIFRKTHVLSYNGSMYLFYCTLGKFKLKNSLKQKNTQQASHFYGLWLRTTSTWK